MIKLNARAIRRKLLRPFAISRGAKTHADCLLVELAFEGKTGRGEAIPYARYGENMTAALDALSPLKNIKLQSEPRDFLPAGAARNALDCALWDLRAKCLDKPAYQLLNLPQPQGAKTAQTLSLDSPETMANAARELGENALIKIKLGGDQDLARLQAIRAIRPNAKLIIDANEGWSIVDYQRLIPELLKLKIAMIEQPFPANADEILHRIDRPIPICADESAHVTKDIERLKPLYDMVNIKLDKTGGLSEALDFAQALSAQKIPYMIGCMIGSSLSMAPAQLLTGQARYVDLDGPLFLTKDEQPAIEYHDGFIYPAVQELWG